MAVCSIFVCESYAVYNESSYDCASYALQRVLKYNFSKEQCMLLEDDSVIETCRSILNILM